MGTASEAHVVTCFAAILVISIAVMGQLYYAERRISFLEPDAVLIIVLVFAAFGVIYYLRSPDTSEVSRAWQYFQALQAA